MIRHPKRTNLGLCRCKMTYYVILVSGVPEAVTTMWDRAKSYQRELESKNRTATILPCIPLERLSGEPEQDDK